jgi:hypothetical protein
MDSNAPMHRYAWLEHEEGMWYFLTDLFADPGESNRRWSDKMRALDELRREGWAVISPYPDKSPNSRRLPTRTCGYGLMWISN